jgi:hypothetical protein
MARYGKAASDKVAEVMHERKEGSLKSGSSGKTVKSRKQAVAIGLSQARRAGAKVPAKEGAKSKSGARSSSSRAKSSASGTRSTSSSTSKSSSGGRAKSGRSSSSARSKSGSRSKES